MELEIIYQDACFVAVNKPHGLLVHRSKLAKDAKEFALQMLRNQIGNHVFPCHRLDRKTSGVLLFAKDAESNKMMQKLFYDGQVQKTYLAIVRGFCPENGSIDYPLKREDGSMQEAITHFRSLSKTEIEVPYLAHPTSRYSLVEVSPKTGRMHQIRKHLAHIFHPIIGDRPHGCNKQNKLFKEKWQMTSMMLHAAELSFIHPISRDKVHIKARLSEEFKRTIGFLDLLHPQSES
jgi:tRNA pseudouridine65 synthase